MFQKPLRKLVVFNLFEKKFSHEITKSQDMINISYYYDNLIHFH